MKRLASWASAQPRKNCDMATKTLRRLYSAIRSTVSWDTGCAEYQVIMIWNVGVMECLLRQEFHCICTENKGMACRNPRHNTLKVVIYPSLDGYSNNRYYLGPFSCYTSLITYKQETKVQL